MYSYANRRSHDVMRMLLILSQSESGLSNLMEVRQLSSLLCAFRRVRLAIIKLGGFFSYTKGCPDRWFGHAPPKLKSSKNNSSFLVGESQCVYACVPRLCFLEDLYRVDETATIVLTRHFDFLL